MQTHLDQRQNSGGEGGGGGGCDLMKSTVLAHTTLIRFRQGVAHNWGPHAAAVLRHTELLSPSHKGIRLRVLYCYKDS